MVALALALAVLTGTGLSATNVSETEGAVQAKAAPELIARGRYLADAADCSSCHTAPGGAPYAGGLPLLSGFGTIYTTNISPDKEYGIGAWTSDDLWHTLHEGLARGGRHLYPAMPYTSYRGITRADSDAIYAYLMSLPPMHVPHPKTHLRFPYNIRGGLAAWKALFLPEHMPATSAGSGATWQRGRYVIDVLGHCGECHTPRGSLGQLKLSRPLSGNVLGQAEAPDITPISLVSRGWTEDGLRAFLAEGLAPQGSAFSEMHSVIAASTQHLSAADLQAAVTYLLGDTPPAMPPLRKMEADPQGQDAGRAVYMQVCAGCHRFDGTGRPHAVVALQANSTLRLRNARNLIVCVLHGVEAVDFPGLEPRQAMPGFADVLSDQQVADLLNYLRAGWGGQPPDVTVQAVHRLRWMVVSRDASARQ